MKLRILVDTNILIGLEDNKKVDDDLSSFYRMAIAMGCNIYVHSGVVEDIFRDRDLSRRDILYSKIDKYEKLPSPAKLTDDFIDLVGQKNQNDRIDNEQLLQVYKGYVDWFITEDRGIHKKAQKINLEIKVLSVKYAIAQIKKEFDYIIPRHPILKHGSIRKIEQHKEEQFFDSLKSDYKDFDRWIDKCLKENRQCYFLTVEGRLSALLIYNNESVEQHRLPEIFKDTNVYENALKMCTFKTNEDSFGLKIGELFLCKMFQLCIEKQLRFLYLTVQKKQLFLIQLLKQFGFGEKYPKDGDETRDILLIKDMRKPSKDILNVWNEKHLHPFYSDNEKFSKFIIPIQPRYYDSLFKDSSLRPRRLFDKDPASLNEIQGNSIIKAYICRAKKRNLKTGDLLFFYASKSIKAIQPVCILDKSHTVSDLKKLKAIVRGKTVFSETELEDISYESPDPLFVLIFRLVYYLKNSIELKDIRKLKLKCFDSKFTTITDLPETEYKILKKEGFFDERYIIH